MPINKMNKIKETFKHINDNWKEEEYRKCLVEWKQIQPFISKEQTPYHCNGCNTYWTSVQFVNDHDNICPNCDTYSQPFLCNPINYSSVLEYINPKFHHYLIDVYEKNFVNDSNNYLLCRYKIGNILEMNTIFFLTINNTYNYILDNFNMIKPDNFCDRYLNYINGNHVKNGHNMLFSEDYVFSFEHNNYAYELYRIDKNSKYALLIFNIGMNLIGSIEGFNEHEDAVKQMKKEYIETFDDTNICDDDNIELIQHNDTIFAMIFKCI